MASISRFMMEGQTKQQLMQQLHYVQNFKYHNAPTTEHADMQKV